MPINKTGIGKAVLKKIKVSWAFSVKQLVSNFYMRIIESGLKNKFYRKGILYKISLL